MNCPIPLESNAPAVPNAEPGKFTCVCCLRDLPIELAAWDVDPEAPLTVCLECVDDPTAEPAPEFAREVA